MQKYLVYMLILCYILSGDIMNEIIKSLKQRKSVRQFLNKEIPSNIKNEILNAAITAPTAGNMTLYTVLDITDNSLKQKLSISCDNQPFIATAKMVLVFCADYYRWFKAYSNNSEYVRPLGEGDLLLANQDALIAAQNAVVAAESFGIGSCYIGDIIENYELHKELLNLPDYVVPTCMVVFGYPTEMQTHRVKPPRFNLEDIVYENTYNKQKADNLEKMLMERQNLTDEEIGGYIKRFCERKHNGEFSKEMTRSSKAMIKDFCKGS